MRTPKTQEDPSVSPTRSIASVRVSRSQDPASAKGQASTTKGSKLVASAYKLDETAQWTAWGSVVAANFRGRALTGSPRYVRVCRRGDIGMNIYDKGHRGEVERQVSVMDFPGAIPKSPDDVFLVIKQHLASTRVHQVTLRSSRGALHPSNVFASKFRIQYAIESP